MILHASFTVGAPRKAAEALAQLMAGDAFPFPQFGEDAWIAMSGDDHGTLVEFLPRGTEFHYVPGGTVAHCQGEKARESGCHILIETPHDEACVQAIAGEYGCLAHRAKHGPLELIELWIENFLLIEVATPQMAVAYKKLATLANMRLMIQPDIDRNASALHVDQME
jgi:hypothetical protein